MRWRLAAAAGCRHHSIRFLPSGTPESLCLWWHDMVLWNSLSSPLFCFSRRFSTNKRRSAFPFRAKCQNPLTNLLVSAYFCFCFAIGRFVQNNKKIRSISRLVFFCLNSISAVFFSFRLLLLHTSRLSIHFLHRNTKAHRIHDTFQNTCRNTLNRILFTCFLVVVVDDNNDGDDCRCQKPKS